VNLAAVLLWCLSTDKLGRRTLLLPLQTLLCFILFTVGGLYWSGATTGAVAAGTALVSLIQEASLTSARHLLFLDFLFPGYRHVAVCLFG
jgi:hypothetical protein